MENGGAVQGQAEGQGQAQAGAGGGRSGWQMLRSILFQMVIFYFITSFFRGRQQPPPADPEGRHPAAGANLFPKGQEMVGPHHVPWYTSYCCAYTTIIAMIQPCFK